MKSHPIRCDDQNSRIVYSVSGSDRAAKREERWYGKVVPIREEIPSARGRSIESLKPLCAGM